LLTSFLLVARPQFWPANCAPLLTGVSPPLDHHRRLAMVAAKLAAWTHKPPEANRFLARLAATFSSSCSAASASISASKHLRSLEACRRFARAARDPK